MSSTKKYYVTGENRLVVNRKDCNNNTNNIKTYSVKKSVVEKSIKSSYNTNESNYIRENPNENRDYRTKYKFPVIKTQYPNGNIYQSKDIKVYEYSTGNTSDLNSVNLKHHPNQVNNLIQNHKYYTSSSINKKKESKAYHSRTNQRTEKSERVQSLSPVEKTKYLIETKKVEFYDKLRNSSASDSSKETNISISKTQIRKLIANLWLQDMYCSNVESLCCLCDNQNIERNDEYYNEIYEKELEQKTIKIKEYESKIMKLQSLLNMKEQEMKKLVQNLKQSENALKIKNKKIYELNAKSIKKEEALDKDSHELQIISTREKKINANLDTDSHSLQIISMKEGWNNINIPSPVNEIYIQTVVNQEEMRRIKLLKEEELIRRKYEKISNYQIQEMGLLSIITRKPEKNNLCQHLESISIFSLHKPNPLKFQKIEEIAIISKIIKRENEIQELDGLEIIHYKKNKKSEIKIQKLNGFELQRDYDMLLVKPCWNSLKIQGIGLNLLAMPRDIELENQEIDEFEIHGTKPEKIGVLMPLVKNNVEKINNFEIIGKVKMKEAYKINKERINLLGVPKKEEKIINWNELLMPIKTTKLLLRRDYEKLKPKKDIIWDDIIKPITNTKLTIKEQKKKINVLKMVQKDKFNFLYSIPEKPQKEIKKEFDIENIQINLIAKKKVKKPLKMIRTGLSIKAKEKKKTLLIKNKMDSINLFGLTNKIILIPSQTQYLNITGEEIIDLDKNWNQFNKVMKTRDLNIPKKVKTVNKISKKVVNIEIKSNKTLIVKVMKATKLFIKGITKPLIKKPSLKEINEGKLFIPGLEKIKIQDIKINKKPKIILKQAKENKIFIKGINKIIVEKPEKKVINWNELIKVNKIPNINIIPIIKKPIFTKQNLNSINFKGIEQVKVEVSIPSIPKQEKIIEKVEIKTNWTNLLKQQKNVGFEIKGKIKVKKTMKKLLIVKVDNFTFKREQDEEIIYNDDYNYLKQEKKENGKKISDKENQEKIIVVKEKEIIPTVQREIRAQVIKVMEEPSESSSQSDVDVLAGIQKRRTMALDIQKTGYQKKVINGEVIFTPKINLGVNLGGAKYKKEIIKRKALNLNYTKEKVNASGLEISGNNGEIRYENMSGIGGAIKDGNYAIDNGINTSKLIQHKNLTMYQSTNNIRKINKINSTNDSKKKTTKNLFMMKSQIGIENANDTSRKGNLTYCNSNGNIKTEGNKKIIVVNSKHYENNKQGILGRRIKVRKEETYSYEHKDNENLNNTEQ